MMELLRPALIGFLLILTVILQSFMAHQLPWLAVLDFPLILILYIALTRDRLLLVILLAIAVGIWQDSLSLCPLGMNGLVKLSIGTVAFFASAYIAVDRINTRWGVLFSCASLSALLFWSLRILFLNRSEFFPGQTILLGGLMNATVGLLFFYLFDKILKKPE
jgi:rod shape-determining protein MreD